MSKLAMRYANLDTVREGLEDYESQIEEEYEKSYYLNEMLHIEAELKKLKEALEVTITEGPLYECGQIDAEWDDEICILSADIHWLEAELEICKSFIES